MTNRIKNTQKEFAAKMTNHRISRPTTPPRRSPTALALAALALVSAAVAGCGGDDQSSIATSPAAELRPTVGAELEVGDSPTAIAVGEGGVWVAENGADSVVRIDPGSGEPASDPIAVGAGPAAIATGEGAVWVAAGDDSISRIDPATMSVELASVSVGDPRGIAAGEGAIWVSSGSDDTVTRIDPESLAQVGEPIAVGADPGDVAVGDGRVWVVNTKDGTVSRINAGDGLVETTTDVGEVGAFALTMGEDAVWVAATDDRLNREINLIALDPADGAVRGNPVPLPDAAIPVRLAAGEGAVWATLVGGSPPPDFDPLPSQVTYLPDGSETLGAPPLDVGKRPSGIAVGEGAVWVTGTDDDSVTMIDPR